MSLFTDSDASLTRVADWYGLSRYFSFKDSSPGSKWACEVRHSPLVGTTVKFFYS